MCLLFKKFCSNLEEEIKRQKRKVALEHLAKGQISKAVARLTSHGVADTRDPTVMAGLRSKYVARGREMPATVTLGQPVDRVAGLKDTLLNIGTGTSPGTGGMRGEFLTCLAEVWQDGQTRRLFNALPDWGTSSLVLQGGAVSQQCLFSRLGRGSPSDQLG